MDFFDITSKHIQVLNNNEKEIYNYIIHHLEEIKNSTIRELAAELYISPATFIRFLKKIGFSGYSDFITVLKYTDQLIEDNHNPFVVSQEKYRTEYLKNFTESIRVLDTEKIKQIVELLNNKQRLIVIARGLNKSIAHYFEYIFSGFGFEVIFPEDYFFRKMWLNSIRDSDLVFFFSYGGEDMQLIQNIQELNVKSKATVISITSANNNTIQNLSHINLYVFADNIEYEGINMTSRVAMIGIIELIAYQYMEELQKKQTDNNE